MILNTNQTHDAVQVSHDAEAATVDSTPSHPLTAQTEGSMRKIVKMTLPLECGKTGGPNGQDYLFITVKPNTLKDWVICLHMLYVGLVNSFVFFDAEGNSKIEVRRGDSTGWKKNKESQSFQITMSMLQILGLLHFLSLYYRDGVSGADHLDIETDTPQGGYITIKVEECAPPISLDEFHRIMRAD